MLPDRGKHGMKKTGKGSGKVMPSGHKAPESDREPIDSAIPIIRVQDNARLLPRYAAVLTRVKDESVAVEDLDAIQLELESLLSFAAIRHRTLLDEISQLEPLDDKRKSKVGVQKPQSISNNSPSTSLLKRSVVRPENRPPKKIKTDSPKFEVASTSSSPYNSGGGKLNRQRGPPDAQSPKPDAPELPKNEVPDKFWASMEPYCRDITPDDIAYLQDLIRTREEERSSDLFTIPPLGKHYTQRWAEEDGVEIPKKTHLSGSAGPMTQRLMAALVEERNVSQGEIDLNRAKELSGRCASSLSHFKSLSFESRVREELREQGILDGDEAPKEQADDELLLEIKRCQSELKALSNQNIQRLRHLLTLADAQMRRQESKKRLAAINAEVLKLHAMRVEKKQLSRKEKELAWRYLKEMKSELQELYPNLSKGQL